MTEQCKLLLLRLDTDSPRTPVVGQLRTRVISADAKISASAHLCKWRLSNGIFC